MYYADVQLYRQLRARGLSPRNALRTLKRGADAVALATALRDALGHDAAVALLEGLLQEPYGAQRAAAVLRKWVPEATVQFPYRRCGVGIHAGAFYKLLRRTLQALPYVGDAPEPAAVDVAAAVQAAIAAFEEAAAASSSGWKTCVWRQGAPYRLQWVFRHGPVVLTVVEEHRTSGYPLQWVARARVTTPFGVVSLDADALDRLGVSLAV